MNRRMMLTASGVLSVLLLAAAAAAAPSKDEVNLAREIARLNATASTAPGKAAVLDRLRKNFGVAGDLVLALSGKGYTYGESAVVLALASKVPGGVTDQNVGKVVALQQGPPVAGWKTVAIQLDVKLGFVVSQVRKVNNEARREMKAERGMKPAPRGPENSPRAGEGKKVFTGEGKDMTRGRDAD